VQQHQKVSHEEIKGDSLEEILTKDEEDKNKDYTMPKDPVM
jgi:hypothetical protein